MIKSDLLIVPYSEKILLVRFWNETKTGPRGPIYLHAPLSKGGKHLQLMTTKSGEERSLNLPYIHKVF